MNVESFDPVSLDSIECRREWNSRIRNIRLFILSNLESFDPVKLHWIRSNVEEEGNEIVFRNSRDSWNCG